MSSVLDTILDEKEEPEVINLDSDDSDAEVILVSSTVQFPLFAWTYF